MFDELAPVHDRLATLLSLGMDRRWRAAVVAETRLAAGDSAIDVAAGTGRLAADLADRVGPFGRVVAVDLSPGMVERGTARARDIVQLEFLLGDALALPFDDGRFGAATIAFGMGALADPTAVLRELRRVVRPGGRVVCLEPTMPSPRWWGAAPASDGPPAGPARRVGDGPPRRLSPLERRSSATCPTRKRWPTCCGRRGWSTSEYRRLGLGAVALHAGTVPPG